MSFFLILLSFSGSPVGAEVLSKCQSAVSQAIEYSKEGQFANGGKRPIPVECQYYQVKELSASQQQALLDEARAKQKQISMDMKLSLALGELMSSSPGRPGSSSKCESMLGQLLDDFGQALARVRFSSDLKSCRMHVVQFQDRWSEVVDCGSTRFSEVPSKLKSDWEIRLKGHLDAPTLRAVFDPSAGLSEVIAKFPTKAHAILSLECDRKSQKRVN